LDGENKETSGAEKSELKHAQTSVTYLPFCNVPVRNYLIIMKASQSYMQTG